MTLGNYLYLRKLTLVAMLFSMFAAGFCLMGAFSSFAAGDNANGMMSMFFAVLNALCVLWNTSYVKSKA